MLTSNANAPALPGTATIILERRWKISNEFPGKAADIIGLYLHRPQHAAVFCVNEKTAIQALDRLHPVLPLSPGRAA
jgi:hypothetical protein